MRYNQKYKERGTHYVIKPVESLTDDNAAMMQIASAWYMRN